MKTLAAFAMMGLIAFASSAQRSAEHGTAGTPERTVAHWLQEPLTDWNSGLTAVPHAPANKTAEQEWARCSSVRKPSNANEKEVAAAGWHLSGIARSSGKLSIIRVAGGLDEMCHPVDYQSFVFQGKQFVGALSPAPMNTRNDGELDAIIFPGDDHIVVDAHGYVINAFFSHYAAEDAACCPSMTVVVHYLMAGQGASLHLLPKAAVLFRNAGH